ncbi:MAG TPA: hypothetical protein VGJ70_26010 [Solirubrobacteraceae bacterium]|jgi:hypothetical protein
MNQALLITGAVVAVGPLRRAVARPAAKLAIKGGLTVVDATAGAFKGLGDVYTEARDEARGKERRTAAATDGAKAHA